jgi:hypothetical protein
MIMRDENLTFAMALPPGWQELDLLEPGASEELGVPLANALAFAARGTDQAQLLMLRSLFAVTSAHEPLAAGLCVALADPSAPVSESPLSEDAFAGAEIAGVTLPAGAGLRVKRFVPAMVGDLPVAALQVQYLLQTEHGLLTITLNTPQAAETEDWEHLFDALAATAELR